MITKEEFYERYINHWMRSDIGSMRSNGNNFPLALCTLSYIEFLGSILTGDGSLGKGKDNLKKYIEECFDNKNHDIDILWDVFRNGLAHDYFPRGGVSKEGPGPLLNINGKIVLNIADFSKEFLDSLEKFKVALDREDSTENFEKRISNINVRIAKFETDHLHKLGTFPPLQVEGATGSIFVKPAPVSGLTQIASMLTAGIIVKKDIHITPLATSDLNNDVVLNKKKE